MNKYKYKATAKIENGQELTLEGSLNQIRVKVRWWLDHDVKQNYASLRAEQINGTKLILTGVRSTAHKHFHVATATRG